MLIGSAAGHRVVGNLFMVSDHFSDDEVEEFLREGRVESAACGISGEVAAQRVAWQPLGPCGYPWSTSAVPSEFLGGARPHPLKLP